MIRERREDRRKKKSHNRTRMVEREEGSGGVGRQRDKGGHVENERGAGRWEDDMSEWERTGEMRQGSSCSQPWARGEEAAVQAPRPTPLPGRWFPRSQVSLTLACPTVPVSPLNQNI